MSQRYQKGVLVFVRVCVVVKALAAYCQLNASYSKVVKEAAYDAERYSTVL